MATNLANVVIAIISYPAYLYFLGYEEYGVWLILTTIINFTQMTNIGIGTAIIKLIAEEFGRRNYNKINQYITTSVISLFIIGSILLLNIVFFSKIIVSFFNLPDSSANTMMQFLPYIGILSVYVLIVSVYSAALSGLGRMDLTSLTDCIGRLLGLCVSIALLTLGRGIESLLIGAIVSNVFMNIISCKLIRNIAVLDRFNINNFDVASLKRLFASGSGLVGSSILGMLMAPFNKIMISRYIGVFAVPVFEIAYNGSMQIRSLIGSSFRALSPEISSLNSNISGDIYSKIKKMNNQSLIIIWALAAPLFFLCIIFAEPLLQAWLKKSYVIQLTSVFQLILFGSFISLVCMPAYYILIGLGKTKAIFIGQVIQSSINLLLILVLSICFTTITINIYAISVVAGMASTTIYYIWRKNAYIRDQIQFSHRQ